MPGRLWPLLLALALALACTPAGRPPQPPNPGGSPVAASPPVRGAGSDAGAVGGASAAQAASPPGLGGLGGAATPVPLTKIKVTHPSTAMGNLPLFVARDFGYFERNGIEAETLLMTSDRAMAAVASGELRYVGGVGTASVAAAANGLPIRAAWFSASSPAYTIYARPEIKTIEQVRGKRAGVPGFGGTSAMALHLALKRLGIDSAHDLTVLQIGTDDLLIESLRGGTIDVTLFTAPLSLTARREGFTPLAEVAKLVQLPLGGLSITVDTLTNHRDEARRVVRSLMQAQQWVLQSREEAVAVIMQTYGTDRATAEGTYDEAVPSFQGNGQVSREGIENLLQALRDAERFGNEVRFEDVAYPQLAQEIGREMGLVP
jgi:NitT/TauT family transport system substrate-binding protein